MAVSAVAYGGPMTPQVRDLLPVLAEITNSDRQLSLAETAELASVSPSHFQRRFSAELGESPTQYQRRLRLERGAALLLSTDARIIDIAVVTGFESHEAFTRAFGRHFGSTPTSYRSGSPRHAPAHALQAVRTGPCVGLFGISTAAVNHSSNKKANVMTYDIQQQVIDETPVLFGRRRVERERIAEVLAEVLPAVFGYAMEAGLAMTGPPFVRYIDQSAAFFELEAGVPLAEPAAAPADNPEILAGSLPGGNAAVTIHVGPYDTLGEAHIALDRWIAENGHTASGGPWEVYLTDPAEVADPEEWQTQIIWPLM